ncbi:type VI secretion system protein TssA [Pseudomonas sp. CDFA 602]|uniref:type VI secretion system protein TssA n=1 Tax=Pseudomonas californiensis TaxID=2829823 RepID=UPI001E3ADC1D|nr:type VI secretion system protein TssA [Pseudomonas californiensis]MCD5994607.1 type VI secretion system protein TssA [Pseudomonas californiensis]MCD6000031.1 type VI secretion system protein TssA [Pseudomonas californiensis]
MAQLDQLLNQFIGVAQRPINGLDDAGEDIRFSPEFDALEAELNITESGLRSSNVDWIKVRQGCESILCEQSKDLRVACWLVWALYQCDSFPGLLAGMGLLHWLCEQRWQVLHPRKSRTRAAAMGWLFSRLEKIPIEDVSIKKQRSLFEKLAVYLGDLDDLLGRHLINDAPLLLPLRRRLTRVIQQAAQNEEARPTVTEQVRHVATQLFSKSQAIGSEKDARQAWSAHRESAYCLTAWWLQQKTTDLRALRLNRTVLWLDIENAPPSNADGITELRGVPSDGVKIYRERLEQGHYADLIVRVESSLTGCPFWLEGQRIVWECLKGLNADSAAEEVEVQLAVLLQRIPTLIDLRFQDGQPFADTETRDWIAAHVLPIVMPSQPVTSASGVDEQPTWDAVYHELVPGLRGGGFRAAVSIIKQHIGDARGGRACFYWQFTLARICYEAKKYELARVQLEMLDQQIQALDLHAWEPDVVLNVWRLLHLCYQRLPQNNDSSLGKDVYRRLCYHDLETVLGKN